MRIVGLFADVNEEKIAEILHNMLFFNELNAQNPKKAQPITFYISTYGGNADDMFAMYDMMRNIRESTAIHTVGLGKVMSAGVLMLGRNKRSEICWQELPCYDTLCHGRHHGSLHNMMNEMEAIEQLQDMYCDALIAETKLTRTKLKKCWNAKLMSIYQQKKQSN